MSDPSPAELSQEQINTLLSQLERKYVDREKPLKVEFDRERDANAEILRQLGRKLPPAGFELKEARGVGSTATVWIVHHKELDQDRALKVPRPNEKTRDTTKVIIDERKRLASVNHQNVIRIYGSGQVECQIDHEKIELPYFIMEFLPEFDDFDKAILNSGRKLKAAELIVLFRDALTGISVLHESDIVHCDIKPGNLLVSPGKPAVVTDLGYAKVLKFHDPAETDVHFTEHYAHPELIKLVKDKSNPDANMAPIPRSDLRPAFDLYAYGRTMQNILSRFRKSEETRIASDAGAIPVLTPYQWMYLSMISKRLLDGLVVREGGDWLHNDLIPGLGEPEMRGIRYASASEALLDFEKLLHLYDLESNVPELIGQSREYIQIPYSEVPLTNRVRATIAHPALSRLAQVSQLGFVSTVYPGAQHTRLEHVYGTFTHCCSYVRALWYDQDNCLFQCIMSESDIKSVLVAALVHDVAQYPMAHDLTEAANGFSHEERTEIVLCKRFPGHDYTLLQVIEAEWGVDVGQVLEILNATKNSPMRARILSSIISGPIDCDKMDYLKRDSVHLGVRFGLSIDDERLVRYLTVVYESKPKLDEANQLRGVLECAEIGVHEKALTVAAALGRDRRDMFTQAYWQHTTRCMKAMLAYAVRKILIGRTEKETDAFWKDFFDQVLDPQFYRAFGIVRDAIPIVRQGVESLSTRSLEDDFLSESPKSPLATESEFSGLRESDDAVLLLLFQFAKEAPEKMVLNCLRTRKLYRRIAVLSGEASREDYRGADDEREQDVKLHRDIYGQFRNYRLDNKLREIEEVRARWENALIAKVCEKRDNDDSIRERLLGVKPLIIIDVPVKSIRRGSEGSSRLRYLTEDSLGVHPGRLRAPVPKFGASQIILDNETFDLTVGKIRVFAHPDLKDLITGTLERREILSALKP